MTIDDSRAPGRCGSRAPAAASCGLGFLLLTTLPGAAWSQETADAGADTRKPNRVTRLQDSLAPAQEWDIGMPELEAAPSFDDRIRAGNALDSEAYLALDRELRQARRTLAEQPEDQQARQRLEELRRALAVRVESNMNLGYLFAARVYIALLEDAGAPPEQVATFLQRLEEISQS